MKTAKNISYMCFESKRWTAGYTCPNCDKWQHNVREFIPIKVDLLYVYSKHRCTDCYTYILARLPIPSYKGFADGNGT